MVDREKVEKALALAEKIGAPVSVSIGLWRPEEKTEVSIICYATDAVERILPHVKRIKRTLSHCSGTIDGSAEIDGIKIRIPCIEKHEETKEELPDIVAKNA